MLEARHAVKNLREYHPPLAGRTGLRLDFNESTVGCSPRVLARLRSLDADLLARYPEREPAEKQVASFLRLDPAQILLTNGVDEAIHLLCSAYLDPGDEAIIAVPTFAMYAVFAQAEGARVIEVPARDNFAFPTDELLAKIRPRTRLIAIANPNNPTGTAVAESVLMQIVQAAPQAAVLVDEAYFEFHGETLIDQLRNDQLRNDQLRNDQLRIDQLRIDQLPIGRPRRASPPENLFIARTFSKAYGLAGLRIGILAGEPSQMAMVRRVASPYSVNAAALAVLPEALEDQEFVAHYVAEVRSNRERLQHELGNLGLQYWPSHGNFVLVRVGTAHVEFVKALRVRGILVRDRSSDTGCEGCVRLTVGTDEHTQTLIHALREVVDQLGLRAPSETLPNGVRA